MALPEPSSPSTAQALYTHVESYPWSSDRDFQSGLTAILGPSPSSSPESQIEDLTLRARCFYFSRKYDTPTDFVEYKAWRAAQPASALSSLVPSMVTVSPTSPSSTQSPLWQNSADVSSQQSPSVADIAPGFVNGGIVEDVAGTPADEAGSGQGGTQVQTGTQAQIPAQPSYPSSFEEIMHLIQTGQPIPGIKDIPDTVLVGQGTGPTRSKRQKPWERVQAPSS